MQFGSFGTFNLLPRILGMEDLDDREIILGLIQKTQEEVSLITIEEDGKM